MSESVPIGLKRVAIALAEQLDYARAAEQLNIPSAELRKQVSALEAQLYFHIFKPGQKKVEVTEEGQFLIKAFREAVALHDRKQQDGSSEPGLIKRFRRSGNRGRQESLRLSDRPRYSCTS